MSGYSGTEAQQHLQATAETAVGFIEATPGACQVGRMMGCDDPDRLGWQQIDAFLERDGVFGFRLLSLAMADKVRSRLEARNFRFDSWNVFLADRETALPACDAILSRRLPIGLGRLQSPTHPEGEDTRRIQLLMTEADVVPFSGSLLVGACGPATTVAVADAAGTVVAAAHCYMPHNAYSPYRRHAWGGLVAVTAQQRGRGLGAYANALMVASAVRDLDATHVYELVSASNVPSRRMVEACGLRYQPDLICGMATPAANERFTR